MIHKHLKKLTSEDAEIVLLAADYRSVRIAEEALLWKGIGIKYCDTLLDEQIQFADKVIAFWDGRSLKLRKALTHWMNRGKHIQVLSMKA
jgi:hypothetical protein